MLSLLEGGSLKRGARSFYWEAARGNRTEINRVVFSRTSPRLQFVLSPHDIVTRVSAERPASGTKGCQFGRRVAEGRAGSLTDGRW